MKTITYETENSAGKAVSVEEITSPVSGKSLSGFQQPAAYASGW